MKHFKANETLLGKTKKIDIDQISQKEANMAKAKIYFEFFVRTFARGARKGEGEVLLPYSKSRGLNAIKRVEEYLHQGL